MSRRGTNLTAALLFVGCLASLPFLVHPWFDATNDGAVYLLTAQEVLAGEGYVYNGVPFSIRPPGLPVMLAPLIGAFGMDFGVFNAFVSVLGALGVVLLFLFARERVGGRLALLLAVVVWMAPAYRTLCTQVMSDVPGAAAVLGCLLLERRAAREPTTRRDVALGLAIGLASYVRSTALLLVPAVWVARLLNRGEDRRTWGQRLGVVALAAVLVVAPWSLRNRLNPAPVPAEQTQHYSYATTTWHVDTGDPRSERLPVGEVLGRVPERLGQLVRRLGGRLHEERGGVVDTVVAALLLGAVLVTLARRREPAELFVLAFAALMLISLKFAPRHLLPLLLVGLVDLVAVTRDLGERLRAGLGGALAAGVLLALFAADFDPRPDWAGIETRHVERTEAAGRATQHVRDGARVGAYYGAVWAVYLGHTVHNLGPAIERAQSYEFAETLFDAQDLEFVLLDEDDLRSRGFVKYVRERYSLLTGSGLRVARVR